MGMPDPKCPACREPMELGVVVDQTHHARAVVPEWVVGYPEFSFWTGLKLKGKKKRSVHAYRCPRCGMLLQYAPD